MVGYRILRRAVPQVLYGADLVRQILHYGQVQLPGPRYAALLKAALWGREICQNAAQYGALHQAVQFRCGAIYGAGI